MSPDIARGTAVFKGGGGNHPLLRTADLGIVVHALRVSLTPSQAADIVFFLRKVMVNEIHFIVSHLQRCLMPQAPARLSIPRS